MNTVLTAPNILKKDVEGKWYSIPEKMADLFIEMNEEIQNAEWLSVNWFDANTRLGEMFNDFLKE